MTYYNGSFDGKYAISVEKGISATRTSDVTFLANPYDGSNPITFTAPNTALETVFNLALKAGEDGFLVLTIKQGEFGSKEAEFYVAPVGLDGQSRGDGTMIFPHKTSLKRLVPISKPAKQDEQSAGRPQVRRTTWQRIFGQ